MVIVDDAPFSTCVFPGMITGKPNKCVAWLVGSLASIQKVSGLIPEAAVPKFVNPIFCCGTLLPTYQK